MYIYTFKYNFFYTTFCSSHRQEAMTFTQRKKKKIKYEIMQNIPKLNLAIKEHEYHAYIWSLFGFRHVSPNMVFLVAYVSIIKAYL
jgi:hypothetical protein